MENLKEKFILLLSMKNLRAASVLVLFLILVIWILYNNYRISVLNEKISQISSDVAQKSDTTQISSLKKEIEQNRKIYVYSMDEVLLKMNFLENKSKFDEDVRKLNEEVIKAEAKIKNLKNAKVKNDFATIYMDSLKHKRDELIDDYQKQVKKITNKLNRALEAVAAEKNASVIFKKEAVAVTTKNVEDVSALVAEKMKPKDEEE